MKQRTLTASRIWSDTEEIVVMIQREMIRLATESSGVAPTIQKPAVIHRAVRELAKSMGLNIQEAAHE